MSYLGARNAIAIGLNGLISLLGAYPPAFMPPVLGSFLLKEDGFYILQEDGFKIKL